MNYQHFNNFVFRTPVSSLHELEQFLSEKNEQELHHYLRDFFSATQHEEALFLASSGLHQRFLDYKEGKITNSEKVTSLFFSLSKYFLRMCTRSTPFGLFAGCAVGEFAEGEQTPILANKWSRHTRFDMNYLCILAENISGISEIRKHLIYYPSSTIYPFGDQLRYIESRYLPNLNRIHQVEQVEQSDYLQAILDTAQNGATYAELVNALVDDEISVEEAEEFLKEIIDSMLLVHNLMPNVSGSEFHQELISVLKTLPQYLSFQIKEETWTVAQVIEQLEKLNHKLHQLDERKGGNEIKEYTDIATELDTLGSPYSIKYLFQSDLVKNTVSHTLDQSLLPEIKESLGIINQLCPPQKSNNLSKFMEAFQERYETREVPLLEALDVEAGIGYLQYNKTSGDPTPLLNGVQLKGRQQANHPSIELNPQQEYMLKKYQEAMTNDAYTIEIKKQEVQHLSANWEMLPNTFSVRVEVLKGENGDQVIMNSAGNSSAANVLGRFCHSDENIDTLVRQITEQEENLISEDAVIAEVAHLPQARMGNILLRPNLRKYEIPYLAKSVLPEELQITLDDLRVSVQNNQVILRSARLNKRVLPHITNAHNFQSRALPIYQFLGDLQFQNNRSIYVSWGSLEQLHTFFPRVSYKNTIILAAKWKFKKHEVAAIIKAKGEQELTTAIQKWRNEWKIPAKITLTEGDNELFIDLEHPFLVRLFVDEIKNKGTVEFSEFLINTKNAIVHDQAKQAYNSQFVLCFQRDKALTSFPSIKKEAPEDNIQREFAIGSEWLYFKLYCGIKGADEVLVSTIKPLATTLLQHNLIDHWFFIRYADPDLHLRVRFHLKPENIGQVLQLFHQYTAPLSQAGLIWKIQADTYKREVERYGISTMVAAEHHFFLESDLLIDIIQLMEEHGDEQLRSLYAFKLVDHLLTSFQLNIEQKRDAMKLLADGFGAEFGKDSVMKKQLSQKFRNLRPEINRLIEGTTETSEIDNIINNWLSQVNQKSATIHAYILKEVQHPTRLYQLLGSYIHMLLNRYFRSNQRAQETVVYDLLWTYYKSKYAQEKFNKKKPQKALVQ